MFFFNWLSSRKLIMRETLIYRPFGVLRLVLALMVLVQHFCDDLAPTSIKLAVFPWAPGNVAVLCFFIMSGFIICEAYHQHYQGRPIAYMKNRLMRIVPGYAAALILSIAVHFVILQHYGHLISLDRHMIGPQHFSLHNLVKNALALFPPVRVNVTDTEYPFIPYAWALQTEMMFYLTVFVVGLGLPFLRRLRAWPFEVWLALAGYAGIGAALLVQFHVLPKQLAYGSYFAFGGAMFYLVSGYRKALWVLLPALVQMLWYFRGCDAGDFTVIAANRDGQFLLLFLFLVSFIWLCLHPVPRTQADQKCGELSYPLYLNHYVIGIVILNGVIAPTLDVLLVGTIASLILAAVMFTLIDRPLLTLRRAIRQKAERL